MVISKRKESVHEACVAVLVYRLTPLTEATNPKTLQRPKKTIREAISREAKNKNKL